MSTAPATTELVQSEIDGGIMIIRLNRPEKKNALTSEMYTALTAAMRHADESAEVRVMVITGSAGCFTAGNDLLGFLDVPATLEDSPVGQFLHGLVIARKPLLAAVAGPAVGIGTTLLLHCDLAYAAPTTKFRLPFVSLGLCPEAGSSLLLPMLCGHARAAELLLLGEPFDAEKALALGLINGIVDEAQLMDTVMEKARKLAAQPPAAVRVAKGLMKDAMANQLRATMDNEGRDFLERLRSPEAAEAFQAFFEKRAPDFSQFS